MGTPYYMAPEQAEDPHGADTRADIYSFGATFYHALTGRPPFDGQNAIAVLFKHKTEPVVSPRSLVPSLTSKTNDLIERCLAKSPVARFQAFSEIHSVLGSAAPEPDVWGPSEDEALAPYWDRYQSRRAIYLKRGGTAGTVDLYEFPGSRRLHVVRGNIVHQEVDAIVSSNVEILAESFGTASAIREAGGRALQQELRNYHNVRPGRAIVTSGGDLHTRFVFHAVTLGRLGREIAFPNRDLIAEVMGSCFYHADTLRLRSIAFPLLGTGGAGWAHDVCLDTMFRFLARTLVKGLTGVRSVRIVIFPER